MYTAIEDFLAHVDVEEGSRLDIVQSQIAQWETEYAAAKKACKAHDNVVSRYKTGCATQQEVDDAMERASQAWKTQETARTGATEGLTSLELSYHFPGSVSLQTPVPDLQVNPPTKRGEDPEESSERDTKTGASSAGSTRAAQ